MQQGKKHYLVLAEVPSSVNFDYLKEAFEYAEVLAREKGVVVAIVEVDPSAENVLDKYFVLSFCDGGSEGENGTDVA